MHSVFSFGRAKNISALLLLCAAMVFTLPAQTFTKVVELGFINGNPQYMSLVQGTDGNLYGTSTYGGGSIFKVSLTGTLSTVYQFGGTNGSVPFSGLTLGTDGNFYGTTEYGGNGAGNVYKITPTGTITSLHSFGQTDGYYPGGGLVEAENGSFYGTAYQGGSSACTLGCGTAFKVTSTGIFTVVHSFDLADGEGPWGVSVQASNGLLYGSTTAGGTFVNYGTIFKMTPAGTLTTLHSFDLTDGCNPRSGLVLTSNSGLYGTTTNCGANSYGTIFRMTPSGKLTTLYNFNAIDGAFPSGSLIQATDGNFYGTTYGGGPYSSPFPPYGYGTIFKITPGGKLTTLYNFANIDDGAYPYGGLVQATNGLLYGTTWKGGSNGIGYGIVFSLDVGLGPFVTMLPSSGKIAAKVRILGMNLTGATSVTFNGLAATFKVVSASEITATAPTGATTGKVQVMTPNGILVSSVPFRVRP